MLIRYWVGLAAVVLTSCVTGGPVQSISAAQPRTQIVLLGTGTPRPDPAASGPATAVVVGSRLFLFDAGAGVMRRLAAAKLPIDGAEAVFITHLHTDHTLGYPDLIFTTWEMRRHQPLQVYGPPGLQNMTNHLLSAYSEDIHVRTTGLERLSLENLRVETHEITAGVAYEHDGVRVTAFEVHHGAWQTAFGYHIQTPDRNIVISGDTAPNEALIQEATGCDVLIHEVYSARKLMPETRPGGELWPEYMHGSHTSDVELGEIAARTHPKLLILDHIVRMGATDSQLLAGVRQGGFGGRVVVGHDLERY